MSVYHDLITLGTTPTEIVPSWSGPQYVMLHNMTKAGNDYIHVGSSTVSTTNSIHIDPGDNLDFNLPPGDSLYAVAVTDGLDIGILVMRN